MGGLVIIWAARTPSAAGYLLGVAGVAYMVQGWIVGIDGFAPAVAVPQLVGYALVIVPSVWLLVSAMRMPEAAAEPASAGYAARGTDLLGSAS